MQVLITAASKHGATAGIADRIGARFMEKGIASVVTDVAHAPDPSEFDAVVLGSGVYAGSWLKPARKYVETYAEKLAGMPVWLFSSGPLGDPPKPNADKAVNVSELVDSTDAIGHILFSGALDKEKLNLAERAIVAAVRSPDGDYRDWAEIDGWVDAIAQELQ